MKKEGKNKIKYMKKNKILKTAFAVLFGLTIAKSSTLVKADVVSTNANQASQTQTIVDNNQELSQTTKNQTGNKTVTDTKKLMRNKVLKVAKSKIGKSYVYGAVGPNAFDCSGLAQYSYRKGAKISLPRTTYAQVNRGKSVSLKHLKKGDLLFWGSKSAPYHVGIYAGNGQYIHAATPSQGVIKSTISHYFYPSCAKRIL